ncbi:alpha/beta fold hydrolase [Streptomyces sp. NPDC005438]|uniref:thioesterase domain-containing protein n=1 Tax=Streptomyces sp. NPDC005438 TaxID=3156880 RepID=UPI0033A9F75F
MSVRPTLVKLNEKAGNSPLFAVHGAAGTSFHYSRIALMLETECPVLGIEASGLESGDTVLDSIEEISESYVDLVLTTQPEGPYRLTGYSAGARIAYAMAVRLEDMGHEVADPVLIGGGGPVITGIDGPVDEARAFHSLIEYPLEEFRQLPPEVRDRHLLEVYAKEFSVDLDTPEDVELVRRRIAVYTANSRALFSYDTPSFGGGVVLVESEDEIDVHEHAHQWAELVDGEVTVKVVPGGHFTMVLREVNQRAVARAIDAALQGTAAR